MTLGNEDQPRFETTFASVQDSSSYVSVRLAPIIDFWIPITLLVQCRIDFTSLFHLHASFTQIKPSNNIVSGKFSPRAVSSHNITVRIEFHWKPALVTPEQFIK
jgi:hypothetical protein